MYTLNAHQVLLNVQSDYFQLSIREKCSIIILNEICEDDEFLSKLSEKSNHPSNILFAIQRYLSNQSIEKIFSYKIPMLKLNQFEFDVTDLYPIIEKFKSTSGEIFARHIFSYDLKSVLTSKDFKTNNRFAEVYARNPDFQSALDTAVIDYVYNLNIDELFPNYTNDELLAVSPQIKSASKHNHQMVYVKKLHRLAEKFLEEYNEYFEQM
jgi:hypothetical protein